MCRYVPLYDHVHVNLCRMFAPTSICLFMCIYGYAVDLQIMGLESQAGIHKISQMTLPNDPAERKDKACCGGWCSSGCLHVPGTK